MYTGGVARGRLGSLADEPRAPESAENFDMAIEIFYLTEQVHRWLNAQVARHLATQAEKLMTAHRIAPRTLGADEAKSITSNRSGGEMAGIACAMPRDAAAGSRCPAAQMGMLDSEKRTVRV